MFQCCLVFGDNVKGHAPDHRMAAALLEGNPYASLPYYNKEDHCVADNYHTVTIGNSNPWNGSQIADALRYYNVFFEFAHGAEDHFQDSTGSSNDIAFIADRIHANVSDNVGKKTINDPMYEFVHLASCWSMGIIDHKDPNAPNEQSLAPQAFGISKQDQAIVGWSEEASTLEYTTWYVERLWKNLKDGNTLGKSLGMAYSRGVPPLSGNMKRKDRWLEPISPTHRGDLLTKLHGVYQGKDSNYWYVENNTQDNAVYPKGE